jgi:RNA recognition motif-containing protein
MEEHRYTESTGKCSEHYFLQPKFDPPVDHNGGRNLIINYVHPVVVEDELEAIFSREGEVISARIIRDRNTGQSLCYGFVLFSDLGNAKRAVYRFNGTRLYNKTLKVSHAHPNLPGLKGANLYVRGFPRCLTYGDFINWFSKYGVVISARILCNATGRSRGVGFIRLETRASADNGAKELHGTRFPGYNNKLTVQFAHTPAIPSHEATNVRSTTRYRTEPAPYPVLSPRVPDNSCPYRFAMPPPISVVRGRYGAIAVPTPFGSMPPGAFGSGSFCSASSVGSASFGTSLDSRRLPMIYNSPPIPSHMTPVGHFPMSCPVTPVMFPWF